MSLDWSAQKVRDLDILHGYDYKADRQMCEDGTREHDEDSSQRDHYAEAAGY
jgi:hypothetical protein